MLDQPGPAGRAEWRVTTERVDADAVPALDPVVERHYSAAVDLGEPFTVAQLVARANGLPAGTPPTETQERGTRRSIDKLVEQGRLVLANSRRPQRWGLPE